VSSGVVLDLAAQVGVDGTSRDTLLNFENANGTAFNDAISGTNAANVLNGLGGIDTISYYRASQGVVIDLAAQIGRDGTSTDTLLNFENANGSAYNDAISSNGGTNVLDGLGGIDTISYYISAQGVTIDLAAGTGVSGGVTDTLRNFENANGSSHADSLIGNGAANVLNGLGGADTLTGGGGFDFFEFTAGQAHGDIITDFTGNGAAAGDAIRLAGFGTAAQGATFTQVNVTQWQIHSGLDGHNEVITLSNGAAVHGSDFFFV
jgi:Ca2+-binding RTX toxin-like protein